MSVKRTYLETVTDAKDRHTELKNISINVGCIVIVYGVWRSREDNTWIPALMPVSKIRYSPCMKNKEKNELKYTKNISAPLGLKFKSFIFCVQGMSSA